MLEVSCSGSDCERRCFVLWIYAFDMSVGASVCEISFGLFAIANTILVLIVAKIWSLNLNVYAK